MAQDSELYAFKHKEICAPKKILNNMQFFFYKVCIYMKINFKNAWLKKDNNKQKYLCMIFCIIYNYKKKYRYY